MKIHTLSRELTLSHLNQAGINEYYLTIPVKTEILTAIFDDKNGSIPFRDLHTNEIHNFLCTQRNNEYRMTSLRTFFITNELKSGDQVFLHKIIYEDGRSENGISFSKRSNSFMIHRRLKDTSPDLYILNAPEILFTMDKETTSITCTYLNNVYELDIQKTQHIHGKNRKTHYLYQFKGISAIPNLNLSDVIFEKTTNNTFLIKQPAPWHFNTCEWSD